METVFQSVAEYLIATNHLEQRKGGDITLKENQLVNNTCTSISGSNSNSTSGSNNKFYSKLFGLRSSPSLTPTVSRKRGKPKLHLGSGRPIPVKQGFLYKAGGHSKALKKKYVIVGSGEMVYFDTIHEYMQNSTNATNKGKVGVYP